MVLKNFEIVWCECVCYKRKRRGYSTEISEKFSFSRKCYYEEENKFILYKKAILFI